jgi:hypothetical protein
MRHVTSLWSRGNPVTVIIARMLFCPDFRDYRGVVVGQFPEH